MNQYPKHQIAVGDDRYNCQLLYFTSSSLTRDDKTVFFLSDRDGHPNLYAQEIGKPETCRKYSQNNRGYMRSYVYFDGQPHVGLAKASMCLDCDRAILYYIQDDTIYKSDGTQIQALASIQNNEVTAFTHVSADGKLLCVPTTDGRALEYDQATPENRAPYDIDKRVQDENLSSYLNIYSTETGELVCREAVPRTWITHVQFNPKRSDWILYNQEWPCFGCGIRRMNLFDGKKHYALRAVDDLCQSEDWTCHEMWTRDGEKIYYHGSYVNGRYYVGVVDPLSVIEGRKPEYVEISLPEEYRKYGHFTEGEPGMLVSDGYYQEDEPNPKSVFITIQKVDWEKKTVDWKVLCRHDSSWCSQDAHPHPIYNHQGDQVFFTSDMEGVLKAYYINADWKE